MNSGTFVILELLGGVALLLWGVRMVRTGVMRGWGDRLQRFVEERLSNRLTAFGGGVLATAVLGSATAMALIVAGLAGAGAISAQTGLAVLLGADNGSALVSGLFASGSSLAGVLAPLFLLTGYIAFSVSGEFRPRNAGRILMGLGLMLMALKVIVSATAPLREATLFHDVLQAVATEPVLGFLVGAMLAWLFHSTLAVILLVASLLMNGSLEVAGAVPLILGINFGGGLPAVSATLDQPPSARKLPVANLFCRGLLAVSLLPFARQIVDIAGRLPTDPLHVAVGLHVTFNLVVAARVPAAVVVRREPCGTACPASAGRWRSLDVSALSRQHVAGDAGNRAQQCNDRNDPHERIAGAHVPDGADVVTGRQARKSEGTAARGCTARQLHGVGARLSRTIDTGRVAGRRDEQSP